MYVCVYVIQQRGRNTKQVVFSQMCTLAPGAMHPAFVQMYRAEVTDVLARRCPAMSSEMAHFALMKCNKIKHACLPACTCVFRFFSNVHMCVSFFLKCAHVCFDALMRCHVRWRTLF